VPYNSLTSRSDTGALIPEEVSKIMLGKAVESSTVLRKFRRIPVGRAQVRLPILSALPQAYWVNGDTGLKQTTELGWANKYLNIEEIATILPVPDNVIADVDANVWDEAMPLMVEAVGRVFDSAVFFGTNAPSSFPTNIAAAAAAAGNSVTEGSAAAAGGYFGDVDSVYEKVEADGFDISDWVADVSAKSKLRKARDTQGKKLDESRINGALNSLDGYDVDYSMRGLWSSASGAVRVFGGDFGEFVCGVRQDITMKILDQAVITDPSGAIIFNLPQQDMTAIRLTFRVGWQVSNRINNTNTDAATRYPVGTLLRP
jgi:HK97 family phage major capsid protein